MLTDLRLTWRSIRARPGFALSVVLCIALGIGINAAVYSMAHSIVLRPLPYVEPERLVAVQQLQVDEGRVTSTHSLPNIADLQRDARTLSAVAALRIATANVTEGEEPAGLDAGLVTPAFFDLLGARPIAGRTFTVEDAGPGAAPVVVIGYDLWQHRFGGEPGVVGRTLAIDGVPHTIVGIMGEHFAFTTDVEQLWLPVDPADPAASRASFAWRVIGRLAPGVTLAQADAELRSIGARLATEYPEANAGRTLLAMGLQEAMLPSDIRMTFLVMLGAVTFVLLVACANVANLLLARAVSRAREMAIRTSLGAGRGRLVRQLLTESVTLALLGAVLGVGLAHLALDATLAALPFPLPGYLLPTIDGAVLTYTALIAVAAGVAFGLVPALQAGRVDPQVVLREGGRGQVGGRASARLRDLLVASQLAFSLVLLTGAALMAKSFLRVQQVDPGFDSTGVLAVRVYAGGERFADASRRVAAFAELRESLAALPGVRAVGAATYAPLSGYNRTTRYLVEGEPRPEGQRPAAEARDVLGDYFGTLGLPLREGQSFTLAEALDTASQVVIVSEGMARRHWPDGNAIGRRLTTDGERWLTVIGIAPDVRQAHLKDAPVNQLYFPYAATGGRTMTFTLRTDGDPLALAGAARRAVVAVDPLLAPLEVDAMSTIVGRSLWQQRVFGTMFGIFAAAALVLASVGLYGVVSYAVNQRVQEIGVRLALGAAPGDVRRLVLGHGARVVGASLVVGLLLAAALTRLMASMLYGVSVTDISLFAGVGTLLAAVALLATWLPARRAARVDPLVALRAE